MVQIYVLHKVVENNLINEFDLWDNALYSLVHCKILTLRLKVESLCTFGLLATIYNLLNCVPKV